MIQNDIRHVLFQSYLIISMVLATLFGLINWFNKRPFVNVLTGFIVAGIILVIYLLSRKKSLYMMSRIMFLVFFSCLYVPLSYFTTPGTQSAMPYLLILVIFIVAVVAVKPWEYVFSVLIIVESIILFRFEISHPEWFDVYTDATYRINDLSINFVTVTLAILLTIIYIMKRYDDHNKMLYDISITDALTGLYNRRYFYEFAEMEYNRSTREQLVFSIVFIDINNFKRVNDELGHQEGDQVLKNIGHILLDNVRSYDIAARYGGDEFIMILPETDISEAQKYVERMEVKLKSCLSQYQDLEIEAGFGVTDSQGKSLDEIISMADKLLYSDKNSRKV